MIFLSYSRKDTAYVDALHAALTRAGHDVWIDRRGIGGGTEWRTEIVTAIESADHFVLVLSPASITSRNVRKEIGVAESAERRMVPVLKEPVELPTELKYQLSGIQVLDLPDVAAEGLHGLLDALGQAPNEPAAPVKRAVADLSSMDGGGFFNRLASGRFFSRKGR